MKKNLAALVAGLLFGAGLLISQMTNPAKVLGFLDVFGHWDPSLMGVMGGAIAVHFVLLRLALRRSHPLFDAKFYLPTRADIDGRLLAGAVLFGVGWGIAGYCPGPSIVAIGSGTAQSAIFLLTMAVGMLLEARVRPSELVRRG